MTQRDKKRVRQNKWVKAQRRSLPLESALEVPAVAALERPRLNSFGGPESCLCLKFGLRGWPDRLVLLGDGRHFWLEFKRRKFGSLTPAQRRRIPKLRRRGEPVYVVRTMPEVMQALARERSIE